MFDGINVYSVNHLDTVPELLNEIIQRFFVGSMVVLFFFYRYIAILVQEETGKPRKPDIPARIFLAVVVAGSLFLPMTYTVSPYSNYSPVLMWWCAMLPWLSI